MTALWTVIVLLSVIVAVDSLAVIALARQVGLLHLHAGQHPAPLPRSRPGPQPGSSLRLDVPPGLIGSQHELILYGFVRPECGSCASALSAFTEVYHASPPLTAGEAREETHGEMPYDAKKLFEKTIAGSCAIVEYKSHALSKLFGEGLVERDENGSFVIPPVTLESLLESARARVAIFVGAAMAPPTPATVA